MMDTKIGQQKKDDAASVAQRSAIANITPAGVLAAMHRGMAQPSAAQL
jgi:hypothetical protein